jgi:hypothetical protein
VRLEVSKYGGVADGERDHLLFWVRLQIHRLEYVADRVEGVLGHGGRADLPLLLLVSHLGAVSLILFVFKFSS